jgi:hypothetical protein
MALICLSLWQAAQNLLLAPGQKQKEIIRSPRQSDGKKTVERDLAALKAVLETGH